MKSIFRASVLAVAVLSFGMASQAAEPPIKIGAIASATGPAAYLGDPELKTLKMYVEKINSEGGVLGRQLQLVEYDDAGDAGKANSLTKRLISDDKVDVIIGSSVTGATIGMIPLVEKAEMPLVSMAGSVKIIEPVRKWVFKTPVNDRGAVDALFGYLKEQGISKLGLLTEDSGFGLSDAEEAKKAAGDFGITIVMEETYGAKDTSMSPQLTKMRGNTDIEAVLVSGLGQGPALVTRNYRELGIDRPLFQLHGVASEGFIKTAGDAANGVRLPAPAMLVAEQLPDSNPMKQVALDYINAYKEKWGENTSTFGGYAYDAIMIVQDAITRAGSTDKAAVRDAIESTTDLVGSTAVFTMSPTDHNGAQPGAYEMVEVKDGQFSLIQ